MLQTNGTNLHTSKHMLKKQRFWMNNSIIKKNNNPKGHLVLGNFFGDFSKLNRNAIQKLSQTVDSVAWKDT